MLYGNFKYKTLIVLKKLIIALYATAAVNIHTAIKCSSICYPFH